MAGIVYLRTNRFEVKLEGITFKAKDFESVCSTDFLFPKGKIWARPPVVGIDVMRHPRDPSIVLLLLCIGVGCLILRFSSGDILPESIYKFLTDDRIHFVGFGIPEKKDIFPFEELGLTKSKADIGYLAAKHLNDPKYKNYELAELARKVLKVKRMIGLTDASSFERHEQIKCSICQLFITCAIAMALLGKSDKKKAGDAPKKSSFLKNLNSLPLLTEGWFKFPRLKKEAQKKINRVDKGGDDDLPVKAKHIVDEADMYDYGKVIHQEGPFRNGFSQAKAKAGDDFVHGGDLLEDDLTDSKSNHATLGDNLTEVRWTKCVPREDPPMDNSSFFKTPLKGILKCSTSRQCLNQSSATNDTPPSGSFELRSGKSSLKRSNSKGYNVSFKED